MTPSTFGQKRLRTPRANGIKHPMVNAAPIKVLIHSFLDWGWRNLTCTRTIFSRFACGGHFPMLFFRNRRRLTDVLQSSMWFGTDLCTYRGVECVNRDLHFHAD